MGKIQKTPEKAVNLETLNDTYCAKFYLSLLSFNKVIMYTSIKNIHLRYKNLSDYH